MGLDVTTWGNPEEEEQQTWTPVKVPPAQVQVYDKEQTPERMLDQAVPDTIRHLIELVEDAMSERVQMEDYGWAALPTLHDVPLDAFRMALLVEQRWKPPRWKGDVPSRLWDAATPSVGYA